MSAFAEYLLMMIAIFLGFIVYGVFKIESLLGSHIGRMYALLKPQE